MELHNGNANNPAAWCHNGERKYTQDVPTRTFAPSALPAGVNNNIEG